MDLACVYIHIESWEEAHSEGYLKNLGSEMFLSPTIYFEQAEAT